MKKLRQILAIAGLALIAAMYIITVVFAFSKNPASKNWLMASIFCTIAVPVLIYAIQLVARVLPKLTHREDPEDNGDAEEK